MENKEKHFCENCGKEHDGNYGSGRFCSRSCANTRNHSEETKKKIGYTLMHGGKWVPFNNEIRKENAKIPKIKNCKYCGKEFDLRKRNSKYCSEECKSKCVSILNAKNGGFKEGSVKNYKSGWYQGIHCDSSWELAFVIYCKEHNLNIERCKEKREYLNINNEIANFYPDFIVENKIIEIKGNQDENKFEKQKYNKDVIFIFKKDIQKYLNYVIQKYGNDFINLYDKRDKE